MFHLRGAEYYQVLVRERRFSFLGCPEHGEHNLRVKQVIKTPPEEKLEQCYNKPRFVRRAPLELKMWRRTQPCIRLACLDLAVSEADNEQFFLTRAEFSMQFPDSGTQPRYAYVMQLG